MRNTITTLALLLSLCASGQNAYQQILRTDPFRSNGYFIVDPEKFVGLNIDHIVIVISSVEKQQNGSIVKTPIETLTIDQGKLWAHVDPAVLQTLAENVGATYALTAYDTNNNVVMDYDGLRPEWEPWPERCSQICSGNRYGWKLTLTADEIGSESAIDITDPGLYFYVKDADWQAFKDQNDPAELGLGEWYFYDYPSTPIDPPNVDCFHLENAPTNADGPNGYQLAPYAGGVWAIRKDKGDWRDLLRWSEHGNLGSMCDQDGALLKDWYNADPIVEAHIADLPGDPGPLACPNGTLSPGLEPLGDGLEIGCEWIELTNNEYVLNDDGTIEVIAHILYVLDCEEGDDDGTEWPPADPSFELLANVSSVVLSRWDADQKSEMLTIKMPKRLDGQPVDPKLIPVSKVYLATGLYEIMIVRDDGTILRRFEEITTPVTIGASFASFTNINVYPVPVKDKNFAIDFDLLAPMDIGLTIVSNMGVTYHTESLQFALAGRNKHLVTMTSQWPDGIYHAVFQYADGSSESVSFTVDAP